MLCHDLDFLWRRRYKNHFPHLQIVFLIGIFSARMIYFDTILPEFFLDFFSIHS